MKNRERSPRVGVILHGATRGATNSAWTLHTSGGQVKVEHQSIIRHEIKDRTAPTGDLSWVGQRVRLDLTRPPADPRTRVYDWALIGPAQEEAPHAMR